MSSDSDSEDWIARLAAEAGSPNNHQEEKNNTQEQTQLIHVRHAAAQITLSVTAAPGCGGVAWVAGQVLSAYLAHRPTSTLSKKTIVELGSGTGLCGLVAAALGGPGTSVWITDQAPLLPIMQANVVLNDLSEDIRVIEYNWGEVRPNALPSAECIDLVLAADCVYFEPAFPLLVRTLCDLAPFTGTASGSDPQAISVAADAKPKRNPEILFCYKKRRKADKRFFALLKKHFTWHQVYDDPAYSVYSREAISLLSLKRR